MGIIGNCRTSTLEQSLDLQRDALATAGAERVFEARGISGRLASRPGLDACLDFFREGDILAVYRLGRSTRDTLELLHLLDARDVAFRSLYESIDTSGPMGQAMLTIISAFAQLEADLGREAAPVGASLAGEPDATGGCLASER